jgi:hypothetical protein
VLLTRLPLALLRARLACVRPAASVRSEPGSNSQVGLGKFHSGLVLSYSLEQTLTFDEVHHSLQARKPKARVVPKTSTAVCLLRDPSLQKDPQGQTPTTFLFLLNQNCQRTREPQPSSPPSGIRRPKANPQATSVAAGSMKDDIRRQNPSPTMTSATNRHQSVPALTRNVASNL